jgi:hypothetical protein
MLPPLDWVASVVIELFVIRNWLPALIVISPALPSPKLVAELDAPSIK